MKTNIIALKSTYRVEMIESIGKKVIGFVQGFKVPANQELDGFLGGYKIRSVISGEYFFIDRIVIHPNFREQGVGEKLIERILSIQTCKQVLLWVTDKGYKFKLITKIGGKVIWYTRRIEVIMRISTKK